MTKNGQSPSMAQRRISKGGTIRLAKPVVSKLDTSSFSFAKFAASFFQANVTGQYSNQPLKKSLLEHDLSVDSYAAKAIWIMVLRFMGDMPEPSTEDTPSNCVYLRSNSVMKNLTRTLSKNETHSREFQEALASIGHVPQSNLIHNTLKRKTKLSDKLRYALVYNDEVEYYHEILNTHCSNLDKLHFIIGHGILRPTLRDEILTQICKQLTDNPNRSSYTKGWILLSLCIGCFPPSEYFEPYLRYFLRKGPKLYALYCENRLERTLKNGPRTQPPTSLELQAIRTKTPITLEIILPDNSVKRLQCDAATNSRECVEQLSKNMGLTDSFGFSIIVKLYEKFMSLGAGQEHIFDAISSCEQYAIEQGGVESQAPWKLYFRKETFAAWYDPAIDQLATHLIYKQVINGVQTGEYRCRSEKDIAMICALEYFVENGALLDLPLLRECIPKYLPQDLLTTGTKAINTWTALIEVAFRTNDYVRRNAPREHAKEDICFFAHMTWPMLFSRYFEALRIAGPQLPKDNIIIAINSNGLYFIDDTEQVLAELSYAEITTTNVEKSNDFSKIDLLHINTIQKENFTFKCLESHDVSDLLNYMLTNLKMRSRYAIVIQDCSPEQNEDVELMKQLVLKKGDLVELSQQRLDDTTTLASGICNGISGRFPVKDLYILATHKKPTTKLVRKFQESFRQDSELEKTHSSMRYNTLQEQHMHTLRKFAEIHFREEVIADKHRLRQLQPENLWRHSCDVLKAPLLKALQNDSVYFKKAVSMYQNILQYMGDIPDSKKSSKTDLIFEPALKETQLCDELFCQLMKQLTENRFQQSEERGWDLLYLATGIMYPSPLILNELVKFLRTRNHILAPESLKRIKRTVKNGRRKRPPHIIEVEGIQHRYMHIYHKIYFPDNTVEAFEIESFTRAVDLTHTIANRLHLKSTEGFSLFVQIGDKAFSMPSGEFVFDYINELMTSLNGSGNTRGHAIAPPQYQLHFMRKLWLNVVPGQDRNADSIFHYTQELPKYINGYYRISKELAVQLAGLIYIVEYDGELAPLQRIHEVLPHIVPDDIISTMGSQEWKQEIINGVKKLMTDTDTTENQLKYMFLSEIAKQETFGSTFFLVKQSNDKSLPETILIAINRHGFHILNPKSKDIIHTYNYNELSLWSSGNTYFHIRFGNMIGASKLLCNTSQGFKMDDLITSYMSYFNENK